MNARHFDFAAKRRLVAQLGKELGEEEDKPRWCAALRRPGGGYSDLLHAPQPDPESAAGAAHAALYLSHDPDQTSEEMAETLGDVVIYPEGGDPERDGKPATDVIAAADRADERDRRRQEQENEERFDAYADELRGEARDAGTDEQAEELEREADEISPRRRGKDLEGWAMTVYKQSLPVVEARAEACATCTHSGEGGSCRLNGKRHPELLGDNCCPAGRW